VKTKRLIVLAAIETVVIALGVCLLLFAFRYTPPNRPPIPAPSKTLSPEQAGWPYPFPIAWENCPPIPSGRDRYSGHGQELRQT
jgi:hypothetical protein